MGILIEEIVRMLPDGSQIACMRPTEKMLGIKILSDLQNPPDPQFLYVSDEDCEDSLCLKSGNINLLLYHQTDLDASKFGPNLNLMVVHDIQTYRDIIQRMLNILSVQSRLSDISNDMLTIIRNGGETRKLLKYAYDRLGNPLMLVDISFNYLDSIGTDSLPNEVSWNYAIQNKVFPLDYISHVMSDPSKHDHNLQIDDLRIEQADEVTSAKQYSMRIQRNHVVLGYIKMLEKNRPVSDFDLQVFIQLAYFLSFSTMGEHEHIPTTNSLSEHFLRSLLEGSLTDKNEILSRQAMFNIKLYEVLYVIVIKIEGAVTSNDQIYYTLRKIRSFFSSNIVTWFNNSFVVLFDARNTNNLWNPTWVDQLSNLLVTLKCTANFSIPFKSLPELNSYYRQSMFCVELRNLFHDTTPILRYEDVFEYHMILNLGQQYNLMDLLHPAVATLMEIEAQGNERYLLDTLFAYNRNHWNISSTAKEMYLHYNTMKHRISRIAELTTLSERNSRDFFRIALSEKILKVCWHQAENRTNSEVTPLRAKPYQFQT